MVGRHKDNKKNQPDREACPAFLPFALSVMVTNKYEYRNNLPCIHGHLMQLKEERRTAAGFLIFPDASFWGGC
jgi:hypothetical protein